MRKLPNCKIDFAAADEMYRATTAFQPDENGNPDYGQIIGAYLGWALDEIDLQAKQIARWQEIARDERAQIIQYHRGILHPLDRPTNFWGKMSKDEKQTCYDIAAKELDLQLA